MGEKNDFNSPNALPMRILLSGSSGFVGSALLHFLRARGHEVFRLVRSLNDQSSDAVYWDPETGDVDKQLFEGFDAVIHLAGENIAAKFWTKRRKEKLVNSRCRTTWLLSQILCRLYQPPKLVICASAIGFYGNRGQEVLMEDSPAGVGFLADLCVQWENSLEAIAARGARVVHTRFGHVISPTGGIIKKLVPIFKWGLGGKLGSGKQIMSWISLNDLIGGINHILITDSIEGPVNFTSAFPVTQAEFAHVLAKKLHRPCFCHIPAFVLKAILGQMAEELLLSSTSAFPKILLDSGYVFCDSNLETAFSI